MRKITQIHVHHTEKPDYTDFNGHNHLAILQSITNYHINVRGWDNIGYHTMIFPDGEIMPTARSIESTPASVAGHNVGAYAVVMVGNFDRDYILDAQLQACVKVVREALDTYGLPIDAVHFHRDFTTLKNCPGLKIDRTEFIRMVEEYA